MTPDLAELVAEVLDRPDWQREALCRGVDPDLFYPRRGDPVEPARSVCRGCVVREECLSAAMAAPVEHFGVWGGLTERERRTMRRGERRAG